MGRLCAIHRFRKEEEMVGNASLGIGVDRLRSNGFPKRELGRIPTAHNNRKYKERD